MTDGETIITDPKTGGQKGSKLARFDLIPQDALWELAEHYGRGAQKYSGRNWEKGYAWSLSFAALQRHLWAFWWREDNDEETGDPHLAAVAWHAFALLSFALRNIGTDDRPHLPIPRTVRDIVDNKAEEEIGESIMIADEERYRTRRCAHG